MKIEDIKIGDRFRRSFVSSGSYGGAIATVINIIGLKIQMEYKSLPVSYPGSNEHIFDWSWEELEKYFTLVPKVSVEVSSKTNPDHYCQGKIEPWDFCISQNMGGLEFNIVKYISRYKYKNGLEDLHKAKTYLEKLISTLEKKQYD